MAVRLLAAAAVTPPAPADAGEPVEPVEPVGAVLTPAAPGVPPVALQSPQRRPAVRLAALSRPLRRSERPADGGLLHALSVAQPWPPLGAPEVLTAPLPPEAPMTPTPVTVRLAMPVDGEGEASLVPTAVAAAASTPAPPSTAKRRSARFAAAVPAAPDGADVPVYHTRLPPAFTLAYELRRGALSGSGELTWQPQGDGYDLRLEGRVVGLRLLALESRGTLDADGIAPVRYTDERRGRGTQAANFQRLAGGGGKITYSGPSSEVALPRGAQDRVTWLVQLAAIAAADPARVGPGGHLSMFVSGARADADVWTLTHVRAETLDVGGMPTPTLRLVREPRYAYDTRVDVWLDPARHYLPVRARLSNTAGGDAGEAFELMLRE